MHAKSLEAAFSYSSAASKQQHNHNHHHHNHHHQQHSTNVAASTRIASNASTSTGNSADRIDWPRPKILRFIDDYRNLRVLWDANTKGYHMKQIKCEALKTLSLKYGTEIRAIRSKIKSLRSSFHREHGKVLSNRRKGISYQPMWFAYEAIRFILDGSETARSPQSQSQPPPPPLQSSSSSRHQHEDDVDGDCDVDDDGNGDGDGDGGDNDYDNNSVNGIADDADADADVEEDEDRDGDDDENKHENDIADEHKINEDTDEDEERLKLEVEAEVEVEDDNIEGKLYAEEKLALRLNEKSKYSSAAAAAAFAAAAAEMGFEGAMKMLSSAAIAAGKDFGEALAYAEKRLKIDAAEKALTTKPTKTNKHSTKSATTITKAAKLTTTTTTTTAIQSTTATSAASPPTIRTATKSPSPSPSPSSSLSLSLLLSQRQSPSSTLSLPLPSLAVRGAATNDNSSVDDCNGSGGEAGVTGGTGTGTDANACYIGAEHIANNDTETDANIQVNSDASNIDVKNGFENIVARVGASYTATQSNGTSDSTTISAAATNVAPINDGIANLTSSSLATSAATATVFLNAIAAVAFGRQNKVNTMTATATATATATTTTATATASATKATPLDELTTIKPDLDSDVQTYCNISAEDVETEIIESDSTEAMLLGLDRSNEYRTNFFKSFDQLQKQQHQQQQQQQHFYRKFYQEPLSTINNRKRKHNNQQNFNHRNHIQQFPNQQQESQEEALNMAKWSNRAHDLSTRGLGSSISAGIHQLNTANTINCSSSIGNVNGNGSRHSISTSNNSQSTLTMKDTPPGMKQTFNSHVDEYGVFGEYVAMTIRKLKTTKAKIAIKHLINNLLYEGELGKYDHGIPASKEPPQLYKT